MLRRKLFMWARPPRYASKTDTDGAWKKKNRIFMNMSWNVRKPHKKTSRVWFADWNSHIYISSLNKHMYMPQWQRENVWKFLLVWLKDFHSFSFRMFERKFIQLDQVLCAFTSCILINRPTNLQGTWKEMFVKKHIQHAHDACDRQHKRVKIN